jgi:hypothetical protein
VRYSKFFPTFGRHLPKRVGGLRILFGLFIMLMATGMTLWICSVGFDQMLRATAIFARIGLVICLLLLIYGTCC